MARSYDLKEIYKQTEYGSEKHLKALYGEKRALKDIERVQEVIATLTPQV